MTSEFVRHKTPVKDFIREFKIVFPEGIARMFREAADELESPKSETKQLLIVDDKKAFLSIESAKKAYVAIDQAFDKSITIPLFRKASDILQAWSDKADPSSAFPDKEGHLVIPPDSSYLLYNPTYRLKDVTPTTKPTPQERKLIP